MNSSGNASVSSAEYGLEKYGERGLLASSAKLGWSGFSAELRSYDRGSITLKKGHPEIVEVCVPIRPSNSLVTRSGGGIVDRAIAQPGRIWLWPAGLKDYVLDISAPMPQVLNIFLPSQHFTAASVGVDAVHAPLRYEQSFQDPLIAEIAFAIGSELRAPTAGGRLLAETLANSLAARLVQRHSAAATDREFSLFRNQGLDRRRLNRVKEYIADNLEGDLTIIQLARVASLSRFHFARAFKASVGQSPHQYVSSLRLERAKELLKYGNEPLLDIAIALNFSSQANFTRAFHEGVGMTPGQYRRQGLSGSDS